MNLEESIVLAVKNKLKDGSIEKIISDKVEKGVNEVFDDLFSWHGDCEKTIEEKVKSVMVPYLEKYDYSEYIVKLDAVLTTVINESTKDNRKILENFKTIMSTTPEMKSIKVSELFSKWCEYVASNVETNGLEIVYDDEPSYEYVEGTYEFEECEDRNWLKKRAGRIIFECEHDENMNFCIDVYRYDDIHKENMWSFNINSSCNISSLRRLSEFEVYLLSLNQCNVDIEIDMYDDSEDIKPEKEPEYYCE